MHLTISSPEWTIFTGEVLKATLPSSVGEITILPWHQPLATIVQSGVVSFVPQNKDAIDEKMVWSEDQVIIAVWAWLAHVDGSRITVTTSVTSTSPSESKEILATMKADLENQLEALKVEGNDADIEQAIQNLDKVTADLRVAKLKNVTV